MNSAPEDGQQRMRVVDLIGRTMLPVTPWIQLSSRQFQRQRGTEMPHANQGKTVEQAMKPIADLDIPDRLRASVAKQNQILLDLAVSLVRAGLAEDEVRTIIDAACTSYREELIATILAMRAPNG